MAEAEPEGPAVSVRLPQPGIAAPPSKNWTAPEGVLAPGPPAVTVAVSVTGWLVATGDGFGGASVVVVDVTVARLTTVAVTLWAE